MGQYSVSYLIYLTGILRVTNRSNVFHLDMNSSLYLGLYSGYPPLSNSGSETRGERDGA